MIHGCKKGKQMKHKLLMLSLLTLASAAAWAVPDLKNPALTPVRFEPAPNHAPLKLIEKGKPNFAIVYDKSNRDRAFTSSVERAALLLEEAVEKCTGVKPAVLGLHEQDKAKQYQYKIHLGYNDITKKLGADPFKGPKQGYQLFTCPEGVVIAGYDSALLDQGKKYSPPGASRNFARHFMGRLRFCRTHPWLPLVFSRRIRFDFPEDRRVDSAGGPLQRLSAFLQP